MVVQHNLSAMNASRMYGLTVRSQSKIAERLSSGYKINRAADNAAGLAISEKMRRQIRGLTQASANCQDGVSMAQVADGALNEMHDILQRINELSVQSANDTNTAVDRGYIQQEVANLKSEINRITANTTFNEIYIFRRNPLVKINSEDYSKAKLDEPATIGGRNYSKTKAMDFSTIGGGNIANLEGRSFKVDCSAGCSQVFTFKFNKGEGDSATISGSATRPNLTVNIDITGMTSGQEIVQKIYAVAKSKETDIVNADGTDDSGASSAVGTYIGHANGMAVDGTKLVFFAVAGGTSADISADQLVDSEEIINLQAGSEAGQVIPFKLFNITTGTLGIGGTDVSTAAGASAAIDQVKTALMKVSEYRSYYGALQNRLEHTINNLDNVVENTTAAESRIRDTDMAESMVTYSNNNILLQAGQAMLSQANQSKQGILSLLQ